MTGFSADWLALREGADAAARAESLTARLAAFCAARERVRILDLGSGTGSNLRFLAPQLGGAQSWTLVDQDAALLDVAGLGEDLLEVEVKRQRVDLAGDWASLTLSAADLVTASALMDLVSAAWFERLAADCRAAGCALFFVLSYDGRMAWDPVDPLDEAVRDLFNQHQRGDKGFGPALGPEAPAEMRRILEARGFRVETAASDWDLGTEATELQRALLEGFTAAAVETAPERQAELEAWQARRREIISAGKSRLCVGHQDLFAAPEARPR